MAFLSNDHGEIKIHLLHILNFVRYLIIVRDFLESGIMSFAYEVAISFYFNYTDCSDLINKITGNCRSLSFYSRFLTYH